MNDDMFAVSDEDQDSGKPTASPPSTGPRLSPLSTDTRESKRTANSEADGSATDSKKRLRVKGTSQ